MSQRETERQCSRCGETRALDEFVVQGAGRRKVRQFCSACLRRRGGSRVRHEECVAQVRGQMRALRALRAVAGPTERVGGWLVTRIAVSDLGEERWRATHVRTGHVLGVYRTRAGARAGIAACPL